MENKKRLDLFLVLNNNIKSRNKAQELIENGNVSINGKTIYKSNYLVSSNDKIDIKNNISYVSRAAIKLKYGLDYWGINLNNKNILDIGSSTGGFIQVCLEYKANKIFGIEVGHSQLDKELENNPKIIYKEKTNFKNIKKDFFKEKIDFITCDVSFISCKKIILKINDLFENNIKGIILLKPQFELKSNEIKKYKGCIKNSLIHKRIIQEYKDFCKLNNIKIIDIVNSPIKGAKSGNIEFLTLLEFNNGK